MGCLFVIFALVVPRLVLFVAFLATNWFPRAFESLLWPALGFLFMPYTTLAYMAAMLNNRHVVSGDWLVLLIIAVVVDVAHWGGSGHTWRRVRRSG